MKDLEKLISWIKESNNIVFFGGAGVSTESGIKDFRSVDGLYNEKYKYPPEEILSHHFFIEHPKEFYEFYKDKLNTINIEPNITHKVLKELEDIGKCKMIITQNIDGLHEKAGSKNIILLHGTIMKNYCTKCNKFYDAKFIFEKGEIPQCNCGGIIKPDVVLYEESLEKDNITNAIKAIEEADLLIIGGTSLNVYPAAGFIQYFHGKHKVLINKDKTPYDKSCDLVIHDSLGKIFKEIEKEIIV